MNKRILITVSSILFLVCLSSQIKAQLTVNSAPTVTQLVQNILLGPGVSASNFIFTGTNSARGSFNCAGACNVGIGNGVLITSGGVTNAIGPNNSTGSGTDNPSGPDSDLNGLHPTGTNPQDAAVIEFDFTVATDSVRFRYVWASEEYHDYVNTACNDFFGFFINGPGIVGKKNIALVPGTTIPISINNVNNGSAPGGTSPSGPCTNCAYFRDNTGGTSIQYDGMTTVLTAATQVCPCETYHIKLAVQDFCDGAFDSGVFLEGNSFQSVGEIPVLATSGQYTQIVDTLYFCQGDSIKLEVNACRAPLWSTGDTTTSIWVTQPGIYYTSIANPPLCFAFSALIYVQFINSFATITPSGPLSFCPGDSVVLSATTGSSYLWSNGATSQNITVFSAGSYQCTVSFGGNCVASTLAVNTTLLAGLTLNIAASGPLTFCQGSNVTLTASSPSVLWSTGAVTQSITVNASGTYTIIPTAAGFCPAPTSTTVVVNTNPSVTIAGNNTICQGLSSNLSTTVPFSQYNWSGGQTSSTISTTTTGTYTVTVSDVNGCTATNTFNLTVNASPVPVISGTFAFCQGLNSVLSTTLPYTNYNWSTGVSTSTTNVSLGSTYSVAVTDANGCTGSSSQLITVYTPPLPSITGVSTICQGANANITASPAGMNYLWSNGSTNNSIQPSAAATYTVTVTDGNGCSGNANQVVSVNNNPTPAITGNLSACQGLSSTLGISTSFNSYAWSNGATTSTISVSTTGNYSVIVTDANGCTGNTSVLFNSLPFTNAVITGPVGFCTSNSATIDAGAGYTNYSWSNGNSGQQLNVTNGGAYTVTVTAANGCSGSSNFNITAWALPTAQITGITAICQGLSANLIAGPAGINYQWSTGSISSSIQPNTSGIYTLTVTDNNGCTNSITQNVTVNTNPTPTISGTFVVCQNDLGFLDVGSTPGMTYSWSTGTTGSSIQPNAPGTYSVIVTNANGCTGTASQALIVNALPTPTISGDPNFCSGDNVTLNSVGTYVNYQWSNGVNTAQNLITAGGNYILTVTDNNGCIGNTNFTVVENPLPQPQLPTNTDLCDGNNAVLNPGNFNSYIWSTGSVSSSIQAANTGTFVVTVTDQNGCVNSTTAHVVVHLNPTPSITGQNEICDGKSTVLSLNSNYSQYLWSTGVSTNTQTVNTAGSYSVVVTDAFGCSGSASFSVLVNPLPLVNITGDLDKCSGVSTTLSTTLGQGTYSWNNGSTDPSITVTTGGIYTVTVTTNKGCTKSLGVTFNEQPIPIAAYDPELNITCEEIRIKFQNKSINEAGSTYSWKFGDGGTSTERSPTHVYAAPGEYTTYMQVTSPYGCKDDTSQLVEVITPPLPAAKFSQSTQLVSIFNSEVSFSNSSINSVRYRWSFGDGQSSSEDNPSHIFDKVGTNKIKLIAYNIANCYDEYETNLEVAPFHIPNAFSPNDDGKNDVFFDGTPILNVTSFDMQIFNRWGQNIYTTDSFFRPWDGYMSNGDPSPEGLYTYKIKINSVKGKYYEFTGSFSLIR
jgi:gliding motility-associated-like protein